MVKLNVLLQVALVKKYIFTIVAINTFFAMVQLYVHLQFACVKKSVFTTVAINPFLPWLLHVSLVKKNQFSQLLQSTLFAVVQLNVRLQFACVKNVLLQLVQ